ncbi:MAG TPA: hypothetical protein VGB17_07080 [Pyrinomonadaceae bacterium]|jgi:hypothetical protein
MKSKLCRNIQREIEEAGPGQPLSQPALDHVEACRPCHLFLQEQLSLQNLIGSLETVSAPANFEFRLRARLATAESTRRRRLLSLQSAPGTPAIAIAACFALLVAAAVFFKQIQPDHSSLAPQAQALQTSPAVESRTQTAARNSEAHTSDNPEQALRQDQDDEAGPFAVHSSTAVDHSRGRSNRQARGEAERGLPSTTLAAVKRPSSIDFSGSSAPALTLMVVQGPATSEPLKVSLDDGRGATRTVSVQPVTFGSHELIERSNLSRIPAADTKGIW